MAKGLEKLIEVSILQWLNLQPGCYAFKLDLKGTWDPRIKAFKKVSKWVPKGGADIIFILHGKFGCLEVKTPAAYKKFYTSPGEHELRQTAFLDLIRSKGGLAEVVCSLGQVIDVFKKISLTAL